MLKFLSGLASGIAQKCRDILERKQSPSPPLRAENSDDSAFDAPPPLSNLEMLEDALSDITGDLHCIVESMLDEARRNGGPLFIGREIYQPNQSVIHQGEELPGDLVRIAIYGKFRVFVRNAAGEEVEIDRLDRATILGEVSALKLSLPTATVRAEENGSMMLTFPASRFREMYASNPSSPFHRAIDRLITPRLAKQRRNVPAGPENREATLGLVGQAADARDQQIVQAIRDGMYEGDFKNYKSGDLLYVHGEPAKRVCIVTEGECSIIQHGVRVATAKIGASIGDIAFLSPDRSMPFSVEANGPCTVLEVSEGEFVKALKSVVPELKEKAQQAREPRPEKLAQTTMIPTELSAESILPFTLQRQHYRAKKAVLMMSALPRVGHADDMLLFLSKLGLLRYGSIPASIRAQEGKMYQIACGDEVFTIHRDHLVDENLEPVLDDDEEIIEQLELATHYGFSVDDARFLLTSGYVLPTFCTNREDKQRFEQLRQRLPAIIRSSLLIDRKLAKEYPAIADSLKQLLFDFDYPLTVTTLLADESAGPVVVEAIRDMIENQPRLSEGEFRRRVEETIKNMDPAFLEESKEFEQPVGAFTERFDPVRIKTTRLGLLRAAMVQPSFPGYGTGNVTNQPNALELAAVNREIDERKRRALPDDALRNKGTEQRLEEKLKQATLGVVGNHAGFPFISTRTKSAAGVVDKIQRMRKGNAGKSPRPDYALADMPDITGGRIIAKDIKQLKALMLNIEQVFGGCILQKDNFYVNEKKRNNPYRVITYTVLVGTRLCEIQLITLHASIAVDIWHNTHYKAIAASSLSQEQELIMLGRRAALYDLKQLIDHNLAEALGAIRPLVASDEVIADFSHSLDYQTTQREFLSSLGKRVKGGSLSPTDRSIIIEMLQAAEFAHRDQTYAIHKIDKSTGKLKYPSSRLLAHLPYVNHSVRVARFAAEAGLSRDAIIAALFHDTLEDQPQAWENSVKAACPEGARTLVEALSEKPEEPRESYMARMRLLTGEAKLVKALDRLDNLLRGHTMLNVKYLTRTLKECEEVYDNLFERDPACSLFRSLYQKYRASMVHVRDALQAREARGETGYTPASPEHTT